MLTSGGWRWTRHATERALDMALDPKALRALLSAPQVRTNTTGGADSQHDTEGREVWAHGKVAAIVDPGARIVYTVLWRGTDYVRGQDEELFRD